MGKNYDKPLSDEEIEENIKIIGIRSTWMLGFLIVIILALANYLSNNLSLNLEIESLAWFARVTVLILCSLYLLMLLAYIWPLIVPNFKEHNAQVLEKLDKRFKSLIFLFIVAIPASMLIASAARWYLLIG